MTSVTRTDIAADLRGMGLEAGAEVMVHSSLSSLGHVEGGAATVVEAFLDVLGSAGTLMVPTFTHSGTEYFDPLVSPSKNGAITEAVRARPEAVRSLHPTHAVTAIGPDAGELVEEDLEHGALGRGCALDKLARRGGSVFLLGVDHIVNSTIHIGEDYGGDNRQRGSFTPENPKIVVLNHPERGEVEIALTEMMGSTVAFELMEDELRSRGQLSAGHIGPAPCQLMRGQHVIDAAIDIVARHLPT